MNIGQHKRTRNPVGIEIGIDEKVKPTENRRDD